MIISKNVMVSMRAGVRLATDVYRPSDYTGDPLDQKLPAILSRTSYDKSNPVILLKAIAENFVDKGYAVVV